MYKIFIESFILGIITSVLGVIIINILTKFNNYEKNSTLEITLNKFRKTYIIPISLFFTGMLIHILLEFMGLSTWQCNKICMKDKCKIVCEREL